MNRYQIESQMTSCADPATMFPQPCETDPRVNPTDVSVAFRNFGETTLQEVRDRLHSINLRLGMRVPQNAGG